MKTIYHFVFFITFVSSCLAIFLFPVSAQTIGSGGATISENDHTNIEGGHLGTSSIVQGGALRFMTVTIASGEQSKTRMKGGTAGVNESPDTGSDWNTEGNYDKQPSVQFRGKQRGGIEAKEYFPTFYGTVEYFGEGGGEEKNYSWSVNAMYNVKDIEIHRKVAGGPFVKISDVQNVDPVIVGQKVTLKVVIEPLGTSVNSIQWVINGGDPIKNYIDFDFDTGKYVGRVEYLTDFSSQEFILYYTHSGITSINCYINGSEIIKDASFGVIAPTGTIEVLGRNPSKIINNNILSLGEYTNPMVIDTQGIAWKGKINCPNTIVGSIGQFTQLVRSKRIRYKNNQVASGTINTGEQFVLDGPPPEYTNTLTTLAANSTTEIVCAPYSFAFDSPYFGIGIGDQLDINDNFSSYLLFKPSGFESIWIPIACLHWNWIANASLGNGILSLQNGPVPVYSIQNPCGFPVYENCISDFILNP